MSTVLKFNQMGWNGVAQIYATLYTVKWVIFAGVYFRYIHDLGMERKFNTPRITAKVYYTYSEC